MRWPLNATQSCSAVLAKCRVDGQQARLASRCGSVATLKVCAAIRSVALLTMLKGSGALIWAAADVLQVKVAERPSMQGLGDQVESASAMRSCCSICQT